MTFRVNIPLQIYVSDEWRSLRISWLPLYQQCGSCPAKWMNVICCQWSIHANKSIEYKVFMKHNFWFGCVWERQSHEWPYRHSCIRISNDKLKSQQSLPCRHRSPLQMLTGTLLPNQMPLLSIQHSSFCAEKHNTNSHDWKHKVGSKLIAFPCINEHNAYAVIFVNSPDHQC